MFEGENIFVMGVEKRKETKNISMKITAYKNEGQELRIDPKERTHDLSPMMNDTLNGQVLSFLSSFTSILYL